MLLLQHIHSCLKQIISVVSFQPLLYFYVPRHKMLNRGLRTKDARPVSQKGFYLSNSAQHRRIFKLKVKENSLRGR